MIAVLFNKIIGWFKREVLALKRSFKSRKVAYLRELVLLIPLTAISYLLAIGLRLEFNFSQFPAELDLLRGILGLLALRALFYLYFRIPRLPWRYFSADDALSLCKAHFWSSLFFPGVALFLRIEGFPRSVVLIELLLSLAIAGGFRLTARRLFERTPKVKPKEYGSIHRAVVLGAGSTGRSLVRMLRSQTSSRFFPIAVLDTNPQLHGTLVHTIPVLGGFDLLPELLRSDPTAKAVIVAIPTMGLDRMFEIQRVCKELGRSLIRIDSLDQIAFQQSLVLAGDGDRVNVPMEQLFERMEHAESVAAVTEYLRGKKIVVTGAGGSIGSEIVRQIAPLDISSLLLIDNCELNLFNLKQELDSLRLGYPTTYSLCDVCDEGGLQRVFGGNQDVVIHAAALKHVPLTEANPFEAFKVNVLGTINTLTAAQRAGAQRYLLISSDKAVEPCNVLGATKKAAEALVQELTEPGGTTIQTETTIVRFGNVVGSTGSVVPTFRQQILRGGPVTVTDPQMTRYFMSVPEAVSLVLNSLTISKQCSLFVLDMGAPIRLVDLARRMLEVANRPEIEIKYIGIRPGERLHEKLFSDDESMAQSSLPKILEVRSQRMQTRMLAQVRTLEAEISICQSTVEINDKLRKFFRTFLGPPSIPDSKSSGVIGQDVT